MRRLSPSIATDCRGVAAVEMALVAPVLLILMFGSVELGNYFMDEHSLVKAVRDGARYAARQDFSNYPDCSTVSSVVQDNTKNIVIYGYRSGGSGLLTPNINTSDITVQTGCAATVGGQNMSGIYSGRTSSGAQIVTVNASVAYRSILGSYGFTGIGMQLNASSQAAVMGI